MSKIAKAITAATATATPATPEAPAAAVVAPVEVTAAADKKAQAIMISPRALQFFNDLKAEFKGPGATKETALTSVEAMDLLIDAATDRRFKFVPKHDEATGEVVFDADGNPEMVQVDTFASAADKIFKGRGNTSNRSKIESLIAKMKKLGVDTTALEAQLAAA